QQTDHAAQGAKNSRFDQELKQDLAFRSADGFSQSDFKRSFGDADEHDVHHHDAADYERDQRDGNDNSRDSASELVDLIVDLLDVNEAEIVFFIAVETMLDAHRYARVFDRGVKVLT